MPLKYDLPDNGPAMQELSFYNSKSNIGKGLNIQFKNRLLCLKLS